MFTRVRLARAGDVTGDSFFGAALSDALPLLSYGWTTVTTWSAVVESLNSASTFRV